MPQPLQKDQASAKARALSARLMAVQACYQAVQNDQSLKSALEEYLQHRIGMEEEGEIIIQPDGALLSQILLGVEDRRADLESVIEQNLTNKTKQPEILLKAIMLCAAYELMAHTKTDAPIIINDYLNVTHGFFSDGEVKLVNAVLDSISKAFRS